MVELRFLAFLVFLAGIASLFFSADVEKWLDPWLSKWGVSTKAWMHPVVIIVTVVAFTVMTMKMILDAAVVVGALLYLYYWRKKTSAKTEQVKS